MSGWVGWEYVGSDLAAGVLLKFYRCTACRGIVAEANRDRHLKAAHRSKGSK